MSRLMLSRSTLCAARHQVCMSQVRCISKREWIKKYREPHFPRKQMLAACEPIIPRDNRMDSEKCESLNAVDEIQIHPYDKLLAKDLRYEWETSRMICILHRNSMSDREKTSVKNYYEHEGMYLRYYEPDCFKEALLGTPQEAALHLIQTNNAILFCPQIEVAKLLRLLKKTPQIILLSAVIDDKFMSLDQLVKYSKLPSLELMLAQVSHTLSRVASTITDNLSRPLVQLTTNLDVHAKGNTTNPSQNQQSTHSNTQDN